MTTTFLFIREFNEQGYPCLVLDEKGDIVQPLETQDFSVISSLQTIGKTIVVLSCEQFSLHEVELPLLSDKKVRQALPYALEDNLTQPVEELHFCFDRRYFKEGRYLVAVCAQAYLLKIITQLTEQSIHFDLITLDWFALKEQEAALLTQSILIHEHSFQGALETPLAELYLKKIDNDLTLYLFQDSGAFLPADSEIPHINIQTSNAQSSVWIALRLLAQKPMNLCQGLFQLKKSTNRLKLWYLASASLFALWLISLLSINGYILHKNSREIAELDQKIEVIYHHFFPDAKQIINPRFRVTQYLKTNTQSGDEDLWLTLTKFSAISQKSPITLEQLNWQNHLLLATIVAKDFKQLDALQNLLKQSNLHIKQTQASTKENKVSSTLEVKL